MKTITLIQAAALLILALMGAYTAGHANADVVAKGGCADVEHAAYCEL
ncbi:hypothetical protein [Pelagimonas varians]|uniref:Uncharacterized protein n=1 Tax=Pelagimonas varians TaxID=696760 RepID=A0A238KFK1_9RHOB|nr:hypothetical protein [Pelagimonas varians]PYG29908.1 hypothetical protein C8N36_10774 [Pelagimonas varians]SMX40796.1 hypothetical protein PEV8663_02121 [Pelagimonas varians]